MTHAAPDAEAFIDSLQAPGSPLTSGAPVFVTRAPGRLDVMGGIADYSGSLVLQRTVSEATMVAIQVSDAPVLRLVSRGPGPTRTFELPLSTLAPGGEPVSYDDARTLLERERWAAYVAGVFLVLMRERGMRADRGASVLISSTVPEGKGVASSAALEVSVIEAAGAAYGLDLEPSEKAILCQRAENLVAGAPCGVMDQMTSACGEAHKLLALLCQPALLQPSVAIPDGIAFWGLDSGERHAVTGSDYTAVRTGAFMGHRLLGLSPSDYLANISPTVFERECAHRLPESLSGSEFLSRYSGTADPVTRVDPSRLYKVREPTAHPVYEHERVQAFRHLLETSSGEREWTELGALMSAAHASYSASGLGSRGTDLLVDLVRDEGPENGLYGARITGGGSGGTVAVVGRRDALPAIERVVERYRTATGYHAYVFSGSSPGAARFGSIAVNL